jgi:hypothetical protein
MKPCGTNRGGSAFTCGCADQNSAPPPSGTPAASHRPAGELDSSDHKSHKELALTRLGAKQGVNRIARRNLLCARVQSLRMGSKTTAQQGW